MYSKFAKRTGYIKPSEIREILKVTENPQIISFAGGLPAPELFPVEEMKEVCEVVLNEHGRVALQYGTTEGYRPLRETVVERMKKIDVDCSVDNIIITTGSQQALDLTGKVFIDQGDTIMCESPTFLAAINSFKIYAPNIIGIGMDEDGMKMDELEAQLKKHPDTKFIYTIPDFQNPTGRVMSLERRKKLIELANKFNVIVIEDGPYAALRFHGEYIPPIKHFDTEGRVVHLGTFSKTLCPGLRIAWICGEPEILQKYIPFKQNSDLHTNLFSQIQTAEFIKMYDFDAHIEKIKEVYGKRRDLMIQCIEKEFPKNTRHTCPDGGLFLWIELPKGMDSWKILEKCLQNNVAFVPGASFFPEPGHNNTFRLNYSNMPEDRIAEGIRRLGEVLNTCMEDAVSECAATK